jgi:hypothetical protein
MICQPFRRVTAHRAHASTEGVSRFLQEIPPLFIGVDPFFINCLGQASGLSEFGNSLRYYLDLRSC